MDWPIFNPSAPLFHVNQKHADALEGLGGSEKEWLKMERNTIYQREDMILKVVVWLLVITIVYMDINTTFFNYST